MFIGAHTKRLRHRVPTKNNSKVLSLVVNQGSKPLTPGRHGAAALKACFDTAQAKRFVTLTSTTPCRLLALETPGRPFCEPEPIHQPPRRILRGRQTGGPISTRHFGTYCWALSRCRLYMIQLLTLLFFVIVMPPPPSSRFSSPCPRLGVHRLERVGVLPPHGVRGIPVRSQHPLGGEEALHTHGAPCVYASRRHTDLLFCVGA